MKNVQEFLNEKDIKYILHEHPAVFTCEEAELVCGDIPGLACKNLFLKNKKGKRYFLVILPADKRADLKKIGMLVEEKGISFANANILLEMLGLEPGGVSPFGLINDAQNAVEVFIDKEVYDAEILSFHPNRNTASLELSGEMFRKYLGVIGNEMEVLEL